MTFYTDNQNYIKIKLQIDMKGKNAEERYEFYIENHRLETRQRIIKNLQKDMLLSEKSKDYTDLFELISEFEFDYLLMSIYLDKDFEKLLLSFNNIIIKNAPFKFKDELLLFSLVSRSSTKHSDGNTKKFLTDFFRDKLGLANLTLESKETSRNDFFNGFNQWLETKCLTTETEKEIFCVLFHFCKVWQLYYAEPYNQSKGIILLNGLIKTLLTNSSKIKINLSEILNTLFDTLNNLPINIIYPPFLDSIEQNSQIGSGYKNKITEFQSALKESSSYFKDYSCMNFEQLFKEYFSSNTNIQVIINTKIKNRLLNGNLPDNNELSFLEESTVLPGLVDSQKLKRNIFRMCYAFDRLKLKLK